MVEKTEHTHIHGDSGESRGRDRIAEEISLLLTTAASKAEGYLHTLSAEGAQQVRAEHHQSYATSTCQWCPVCMVLAFVRGDRSELTALSDRLGTVLALLRQLLSEHNVEPGAPSGEATQSGEPAKSGETAKSGEGGTSGESDEAAPEQDEPASAKVRRIAIRRVGGQVTRGGASQD